MGVFIIIALAVSVITVIYVLATTIRRYSLLHITCLFASIFLTLEVTLVYGPIPDPTSAQTEATETAIVIIATLTSILSCYTLLLVGTNFYHHYDFIKTLLLFAPIVTTFFELGSTMYNVVLMIVTSASEPNDSVILVSMSISTLAAFLSLIYATVPLFNIRRQIELVPEQTAVSIIRLFTISAFFLVHVIFIFIQTMLGKYQDPEWRAGDYLVLNGVFVAGLMPSPRTIVKRIKKGMLGVEEFDIGGDVRVSMVREIMGLPHNNNNNNNNNNDLESNNNAGGVLGMGMTEVPGEMEEYQNIELINDELNNTTAVNGVKRADSTASSSSFTSTNALLTVNY